MDSSPRATSDIETLPPVAAEVIASLANDSVSQPDVAEPEEKERLADEEMEQHRAGLRSLAALHRAAPGPPPLLEPTDEPSPIAKIWGILAVLALAGMGAVLFVNVNGKPSSLTTKIGYVPVSQKIALGETLVTPSRFISYKIRIVPDMKEAVVSGNFKVSGGSENDIAAAIAGEGDYLKWIDGQEANVNWQTSGRVTVGTVDVHLGPGTYYLVFSNKFCSLSQKYILLDVSLNYNRLE